MKGQLERSAGAEAQIIPVEQPDVMRVRRRHEAHWLALLSTAALLFVAVSVAKPWGGTPAPRGTATPAASEAIAHASDTIEPVVIDQEGGNGDTTWTNGDTTWSCVLTGGPDGSALQILAGQSIEPGAVEFQWIERGVPVTSPFPTVPPGASPSVSIPLPQVLGKPVFVGSGADPSASVGTCSESVFVEQEAASTP